MNVAELLTTRLRELGVQRVYGDALGDLPHIPVGDPELAPLLADADGRIGAVDGAGRLGAAFISGPILHLSSKPGGLAPLQDIGSPEELVDALVDPPGLSTPGTTALHLDLDLGAPVPDDIAPTAEPERSPVLTLDRSMADLRLMVIVGPGVVRDSSIEGLSTFTRASGAGVFNTWGAKGVERWDSPWHFGTIGAQAGDISHIGLENVDVLITSGLDPDELGEIPHQVIQEVAPAQLGALCHNWDTRPDEPTRPGFYDSVAAIVGPMYESESTPLSPARAALHVSGALPDGAIAVADPGPAGFWVARTFPTSIPNSVCVPASGESGFAAAAALVCAIEQRPVIAITSESADAEIYSALGELASSLGHSIALQVWGDAASVGGGSIPIVSVDDHVQMCLKQAAGELPGVSAVAVDLELPEELEDLLGPVAAALDPAL